MSKKQTQQTREDGAIQTAVFRSNPEFLAQRARRIEEALAFKGGTAEKPVRHVISVLPDGKEAYFLKPGKEAQRQNPNIHDMFPNVGRRGKTAETHGYTFDDMWAYLVEISIINQILFKKVLVLLYRLCYFIDHREDKNGNLRYAPSADWAKHIGKIDFAVQCGFKDKFKKDRIGLAEYLHFIDLLGWNEDVKYHVSGGGADFGKPDARDAKAGRPNTVLSVISVPLMVNDFLANIIENVNYIEKINVRLILSTMQKLSKARGICVLSHAKLREYLSPYLRESK